jgi:hypothetical protein
MGESNCPEPPYQLSTERRTTLPRKRGGTRQPTCARFAGAGWGTPMKKFVLVFATVLATGTVVHAQYGQPLGSGYGLTNPNAHTVQPYVTPRGTYVQPHVQTNPNNTQMDNFSTRGNVNPYTGVPGTRIPRY